MKTYRQLYPQITAFENLRRAFKKAARGKRKRPDVAGFEYRLEANLLALQQDLLAETYTPGAYYSFRIQDPKPRLISAAPFRDRVVHHALCQVIEPLWERRFIHDTYACRVGKGTHAALDRCTEYARRDPYVLKCDIQHFFPRVDHELLYKQFERLIADPRTLRLCRKILDSGAGVHPPPGNPVYFPGDDLFAALRPRGLPIGNLTSQFWANVYLNPLDQFIKRQLKCRHYLRYVDDFLLFGGDKSVLHAWREAIIDFLAGLRLRLHEEQAAVFPVATGIPFLGWRVYPDHRRLKRRNGVAFQRRFARLRQEFRRGEISYEQMNACVQSWIAHAAHGDTWGLRRSLLCSAVL
ncbi:MAG TPA: reverse transcriptase/maturase family protein [Anaerolineales bacterium]|nr:reverse transcriptase/maturase family protein [Anaerolineales bacterium]